MSKSKILGYVLSVSFTLLLVYLLVINVIPSAKFVDELAAARGEYDYIKSQYLEKNIDVQRYDSELEAYQVAAEKYFSSSNVEEQQYYINEMKKVILTEEVDEYNVNAKSLKLLEGYNSRLEKLANINEVNNMKVQEAPQKALQKLEDKRAMALEAKKRRESEQNHYLNSIISGQGALSLGVSTKESVSAELGEPHHVDNFTSVNGRTVYRYFNDSGELRIVFTGDYMEGYKVY